MTVKFYGGALERTGGEKTFEPKESLSLHELIDELGNHFGEHLKEYLTDGKNCFFIINGKGIMTTGGLKSELRPGDRIEVLPSIEAG